MKKSDVQIGHTYWAKVSGNVVKVKVLQSHYLSGWIATNLSTGCIVRIKTADRLRGEVKE